MKSGTVWPTRWLRETLEAAQGLLPFHGGHASKHKYYSWQSGSLLLHNSEGAFGGHVEAGKEGERDEGERYKVSWNKVSF